MSSWLPKSRKARRRLMVLAAVAPVLALAVGLTLWGLSDSISYFYTPAQAAEARPEPGRTIQIGGRGQDGSVVKHPDGRLEFVVADQIAAAQVVYKGDPPDLFREGQGVVATGSFNAAGVFEAGRLHCIAQRLHGKLVIAADIHAAQEDDPLVHESIIAQSSLRWVIITSSGWRGPS